MIKFLRIRKFEITRCKIGRKRQKCGTQHRKVLGAYVSDRQASPNNYFLMATHKQLGYVCGQDFYLSTLLVLLEYLSTATVNRGISQ